MLVAMQSGIEDALASVAVSQAAEVETPAPTPVLSASLAAGAILPKPRPIVAEGAASDAIEPDGEVVVTRMTSAGGRHWGVNVGRFSTRHEAEKMLLKTALVEISLLESALRKVDSSTLGYEANFVGLTEQSALRVCQRLHAQDMACETMGPG